MNDIPAHRHEVKLRSGGSHMIEDDVPAKAKVARKRKPAAKKPTPAPTPVPAPAEPAGDA